MARRPPSAGPAAADRTPVRHLEFVEVGAGHASVADPPPAPNHSQASDPATMAEPVRPAEPGWSLWGDAEI